MCGTSPRLSASSPWTVASAREGISWRSAPSLYESIRNEPFKIPEDDGSDLTRSFFNPDREGWLLRLGGR